MPCHYINRSHAPLLLRLTRLFSENRSVIDVDQALGLSEVLKADPVPVALIWLNA
jgi:hypothetical protein